MNIGLVLAGGMAKGAYQIGALKAMQEFIPLHEIKYISCSSIGVLNGYAYATDNLDAAEKMWKSFCQKDSRVLLPRVLRSNLLQQNILNLYDPEKPLTTTLYCSLFDLYNRDIIYKNLSKVEHETIPTYLKASVAMPVFNNPVPIGSGSYYDGALVDLIPVYPLLKKNVDYIICIYFDDISYRFENTYFDNKIIKINFPSDGLLKQSLCFTKENIDNMIECGYTKAKFILSTALSEGYQNIDYVYKAIEYMNGNMKNGSFRLTVDVMGTNLNKVTQKLTKRKII